MTTRKAAKRGQAAERLEQLEKELADLLMGVSPSHLLPEQDARRCRQLRANAIFFEFLSLREDFNIDVGLASLNEDELTALLETGSIPEPQFKLIH